MWPDSELDEVLVAAISGIPKVAELIALIPAEDQLLALEAAEKSLQTAHNLGYEGSYEHKQPTLALESARAGPTRAKRDLIAYLARVTKCNRHTLNSRCFSCVFSTKWRPR
jgi:hypothetical protein